MYSPAALSLTDAMNGGATDAAGPFDGPEPSDAPVRTSETECPVHRLSSLLALIASLGPLPSSAQLSGDTGFQIPDGALRVELSVLRPRGDFRPGHVLSFGYGASGALAWGPRHAFDIGLAYRSIAHDSHTYSDTIEVRNMTRTLALAIRYTLPLRYARPYVGASWGGAYFGTETVVERCCNEDGERERDFTGLDLAHIAPMASTRVGLAIDLWKIHGTNPSTVAADLGVETHYGRRATYQVDGHGGIRTTGTSYRIFSIGLSVRPR
jgi:hypothetical protein